MSLLNALEVPTLLVDEARARANIRRMVQKSAAAGIRFRPHFKTHQSIEIGEWFRDEGVTAITVSSLRMAAYFASTEGCWRDITVAFPANVREIRRAANLAEQTSLGLLVDSVAAVDAIGCGTQAPINLWIEVDAGYGRTGIPVVDARAALRICEAARCYPNLHLRGLLTHSGQSYVAGADRAALQRRTVLAMNALRDLLRASGCGALEISVGDTPTASVLDDFGAIDELRPGNFVFYDWMQHAIGACTEEQIAVALACPVVALYPERCEVAVYGGAVHLSKENIVGPGGRVEYGRVALLHEQGWGRSLEDVWVRSLSQEHGMIKATAEAYARGLAQLRVGDLVAVLPVHSCLTADLLKGYMTLDGRRINMMRL